MTYLQEEKKRTQQNDDPFKSLPVKIKKSYGAHLFHAFIAFNSIEIIKAFNRLSFMYIYSIIITIEVSFVRTGKPIT